MRGPRARASTQRSRVQSRIDDASARGAAHKGLSEEPMPNSVLAQASALRHSAMCSTSQSVTEWSTGTSPRIRSCVVSERAHIAPSICFAAFSNA
eukprot:9475842-Alexandrium_andersonii.AAC.1